MKPRARSERAVAAARALLDAARVREPRDLDLVAIAAACGAFVTYSPRVREDGNRLRAGSATIITVREKLRGTPRGWFTIAHETIHGRLHDVDQLGRCTYGDDVEGGTPHRLEREADDGAAELVMPERFVRAEVSAMEESKALSFDDVRALGRRYRASPETSGIRVTELAKSAEVALVCSVDGRIKWAVESLPYDGRIVRGRAVANGTIARRCFDEPGGVGVVVADDVAGELWGTTGRLIEETVRTDYGVVLTWLRRGS